MITSFRCRETERIFKGKFSATLPQAIQKAAARNQVMPEPAGRPIKGQKEKKERPTQEKRKLSYKEAQALESLPQKIEALENEQKLLWEIINDPAFYADIYAAKVKATNDRLEVLEKEMEDAYQRWDELEDLAAKFDR